MRVAAAAVAAAVCVRAQLKETFDRNVKWFACLLALARCCCCGSLTCLLPAWPCRPPLLLLPSLLLLYEQGRAGLPGAGRSAVDVSRGQAGPGLCRSRRPLLLLLLLPRRLRL